MFESHNFCVSKLSKVLPYWVVLIHVKMNFFALMINLYLELNFILKKVENREDI